MACAPALTRTELPLLNTSRLYLRQIRLEDAAGMFDYTSDPEVAAFTSWEVHRSKEETRQYIDRMLEQQHLGMTAIWGIEEKHTNGKLIGNCGFKLIVQEHARAELVFALTKPHWGKGFMTEATHEVFRYGFTRLGLNRIEAVVDGENIATVRVPKRENMTFEGIMHEGVKVRGVFRDAKLYALLKRQFVS